MSETKFTGRYTESGKKIMELETTQEDCDKMNKLKEEIFGKDFEELGVEKSKPHKSEFLFG